MIIIPCKEHCNYFDLVVCQCACILNIDGRDYNPNMLHLLSITVT